MTVRRKRSARQRWHRPVVSAAPSSGSADQSGPGALVRRTEAHLVHSMGDDAEEGCEGGSTAVEEKAATAEARASEAAEASDPTSTIQLRSQWELSQSLRHLDPSRPVFDAEARVESWQRRNPNPETTTDERDAPGRKRGVPQRERRLGPPNSNHSLPPLSPIKFLLGNSPETREPPTSAVVGLRTPSPQVLSNTAR